MNVFDVLLLAYVPAMWAYEAAKKKFDPAMCPCEGGEVENHHPVQEGSP